ncbi:MAG: DUF1553 domain-containing protein [Verrucomicrobia bacterium]|nr:DUF1553 domain-containing protein [Verrucomicrobiota bacterium]
MRTPSDFGTRADPPTHPELLDWLARRFVEDGWSLKKLHRRIMLSTTYQQASDDRADYAKADANNLLLWKQNRQRLDFEELRDTLLAVTGALDRSIGGHPVDIVSAPFATRRTVYGFIDRQNLPGMFRAFDFASPDTTSPQRFYTTVPQQALFMMNSPFVIEQAQRLAGRDDFKSLKNDEQRVRLLYQQVLQRSPSSDEVKSAVRFVVEQSVLAPQQAEHAGWHYGFGEFDEAEKRVKHFEPLPHFTGTQWQGGPQLPDPKTGWAMLDAEGGHAGNDLQHAVIRRWVAPRDGTVQISGTLNHPAEQGDGVRGRIVSSTRGLLGEWLVHHSEAATKPESLTVKEGDFVDFVTDLNKTIEYDSFAWPVTIKYTGNRSQSKARMTADATLDWNSQADFGKSGHDQTRPFGAWERFAQVLLLSNELCFVD